MKEEKKPRRCKNPSGNLLDSVLKDCGQAVCRKKGGKAQWDVCPSPATKEDLQNVENTLQEGHAKIRNDLKEDLNNLKRELKEDLASVETRILEALNTVEKNLEDACNTTCASGEEPVTMTTSEEGPTTTTTTTKTTTVLDVKCQNAIMVSQAPVVEGYENSKMVLCDDPKDETCERDMQTICPSGFHLCTHLEFWTLNDNWNETFTPPARPIGEIYCRKNGNGAGHFTLGWGTAETGLTFDYNLRVWFGSTRPSCDKWGNGKDDCDQKDAIALCCSNNPKCGNGVVEAPMEECDDGNANNEDECLDSCTFRLQ